jgi:NAD(P)-dependent dehydrogenase (short-subunit alcohol dehydrogenase family)
MNMRQGTFHGKVALITGAGAGIGLATAKAFAEAGASVVLADRDEEAMSKATEELRSAGHNVIGVTCDVTDKGQVIAMAEYAISTYGRLDAAFNSAGINTGGAPLLETSDDEFDRIVNVNLRGVWNCMKAELRYMVTQGSGAIVNCSSIGGMVGSKGRSAYSASKHGVIGLTRSAALEYATQGICINAICPGMTDTPMAATVSQNYDPQIIKTLLARAPIGRFAQPEEIAAAVVWLCSPSASYMVGHALAVDGGVLAQ